MSEAGGMQKSTHEIKRGRWVLVYDPEGSEWVKVIYPSAGERGNGFMARSVREEPLQLYHKYNITRIAKEPDDAEKIKKFQEQYYWKTIKTRKKQSRNQGGNEDGKEKGFIQGRNH